MNLVLVLDPRFKLAVFKDNMKLRPDIIVGYRK